MWIVDCQVLDNGKLNLAAPKNDSNTKKTGPAPKNLMMDIMGHVNVGMNFCGFLLQFIAPKNDNTFNDSVFCFPYQSKSLLHFYPKNG